MHLANMLGTLTAIAIALGVLLTTPRRATVSRLREEVDVLRGLVETLKQRLEDAAEENRQLRRARRARRREDSPR